MNKYLTVHSLHKILLFLCISVSFFIGLKLLYSVFQSGYGYQFDIDELHHANLVYQYLHGAVPFRDIYNSFYTPVFEWYIMPIFMLFGFSFDSIIFTRFAMITLLVIRLIAAWFLVKNVFSKQAAWFFIPLFILDPFFVYSGMQIRPDNLMMTLYTVGLAFFSYGFIKKSPLYVYISAFVFGVSCITLIKILPSLSIVIGMFILYCFFLKKFTLIYKMALAFLAPIALFLLYTCISGGIRELYTQVFIEGAVSYVFRFPVHLGFYHQPNNIFIYGTMGSPVSLVYAWILPILGGAGMYLVLSKALAKNTQPELRTLYIIFCLTFVAQWIVLFKVPSAYLQHYLPLNWLSALFAAVMVDDFLSNVRHNKLLFTVCVTILVACFYAVAVPSMTYNYARSTIKGLDTIAKYETLWKKLPANEPVFPGVLFRPMVYPVPFGYFIGNVPEHTLDRLADIPSVIEKNNLQILAFDDYALSLMPARIQEYVNANFTRVPGDSELMVRK